jgi:hypothetical protein
VGDRERRLAANEALFREVNERIEEAAARHGDDRHRYDFVCECSNVHCGVVISMPLPEYERARADPAVFIVGPGHETPEIEEVVHRGRDYHLVRKFGDAAQVAREADPRAR